MFQGRTLAHLFCLKCLGDKACSDLYGAANRPRRLGRSATLSELAPGAPSRGVLITFARGDDKGHPGDVLRVPGPFCLS